MIFYVIEPEVAGHIGEQSVGNFNQHPPSIEILEYVFDGWLGDDILESFPCFVISDVLARALKSQVFSGFELAKMRVSKSSQFLELYSSIDLPQFNWLKIQGRAGVDDFGMSDENMLIISKNVLALLKRFKVENADVYEYGNS